MAQSAARRTKVTWLRFKNFITALLRSRMAAAGLIIIVFFSTMALAASILTANDPRFDIVSGALAPPTWARFFPAYQDRSENVNFQTLDIQAQPSASSEVVRTSDTEVTVRFTRQSSGGPYSATITRTLQYQYTGPPARFIVLPSGIFTLTADGVDSASPAAFRVYLERAGATKQWVLLNGTLSRSGVAVPPDIPVDSNQGKWRDRLGLPQGSALNPSEVIFDRSGTYRFVVETVFPASDVPASITVSNFQMTLYGTSYGLLGTDERGRDLYSQFVYGARVSLMVGLAAAIIGVVIGLFVGLVAGFVGGVVDEVLMRFNDMILVIPGLPLIIVLLAILSPNIWNIILIIGLLGWNGFARVVRSQVLSLRERPFIEAARASGAGTSHILARHVIPNIIALIYVTLALSVPGAILTEAGLSFLGLFDPTATSWGRTINESLNAGTALGGLWWWILPPGFAIAILSLSFILLGYGLDEMFNPKLRRRR